MSPRKTLSPAPEAELEVLAVLCELNPHNDNARRVIGELETRAKQ